MAERERRAPASATHQSAPATHQPDSATHRPAPAAHQAESAEVRRLRRQIDRLDLRIVRLLNERAALGLEVGAAKRASGRSIRDAARERAVIDRVTAANRGPLPESDLQTIYRELIASIRQLEMTDRPHDRRHDGDEPPEA